jgi:hypothetical protein
VTGTSTLTFTNASGVGGGVSAGTYRIKPKPSWGGTRGGECVVANNQFIGYGTGAIETVGCVAPEIRDNLFNGMTLAVSENGSTNPRISGNREIAPATSGARIQITTGTSWPVIYDNFVANGAVSGGNLLSEGTASRVDMGIGVGNNTIVDFPLCGKRGRAIVSGGIPELMMAFGSDLVDGDTFGCNGVMLTYKTNSPGALQFNSIGTLITLLNAISFTAAADYGSYFASSVTTGHLKIRETIADASVNGRYLDTINVLNDTALVIPRNTGAGSPPESVQYSKGQADTGGVSRRLVAWSYQNSFTGAPVLVPDNAAAAALAGAGWFPEKNVLNGGCCEVFALQSGIASISSSSTATGANSLTDGGQSMTVKAFAGYFLTDSAGSVFSIVTNTATVFTLAASGATPASGAYTVSRTLGGVGSTAEFRWYL